MIYSSDTYVVIHRMVADAHTRPRLWSETRDSDRAAIDRSRPFHVVAAPVSHRARPAARQSVRSHRPSQLSASTTPAFPRLSGRHSCTRMSPPAPALWIQIPSCSSRRAAISGNATLSSSALPIMALAVRSAMGIEVPAGSSRVALMRSTCWTRPSPPAPTPLVMAGGGRGGGGGGRGARVGTGTKTVCGDSGDVSYAQVAHLTFHAHWHATGTSPDSR